MITINRERLEKLVNAFIATDHCNFCPVGMAYCQNGVNCKEKMIEFLEIEEVPDSDDKQGQGAGYGGSQYWDR